MNRTSAPTEKWIHSFAVTDVCLHPKKFTVYKITSVVFPIHIPEALTCLTVWKRYNDIKSLLKYVKKRHKELKLPGIVPNLNNHVYFKRFEADVITERKLFIIRLLDYIGQHPILYKSQVFQEFFAKSQTVPYDDESLQCNDQLLVNRPDSIKTNTNAVDSEDLVTSTSSSLDESICSNLSSSICSLQDASETSAAVNSNNNCPIDETQYLPNIKNIPKDILKQSQQYEFPFKPHQRNDLSQFKVLKTFDNVMQVQDINTKHVYIMKAIYKSTKENEDAYLPSNFPFMVSLVSYYLSDSSVYLLLEQATGGKLFDYIRSYDQNSTKNQQSMTTLLTTNYNKSDLAPKVIYKSKPNGIQETNIPKDSNEKHSANDSFYHLLQSYYYNAPSEDCTDFVSDNVAKTSNKIENPFEAAPHFDLIANDLDVNNLLVCSKKLLNSVSHTLEKIQTNLTADKLMESDLFEIYDSASESLVDDSTQCNDDSDTDKIPIYSNSPPKICVIKSEMNEMHFEDSKNNGNNGAMLQLPKAILKRWLREIIFAVKHLHANNIFCYDLQPDNLLLGKNGEILLTYFYRREFTSYLDIKTMNQSCYSLANIAPERPLTSQSDVWSIGVIFFELVTGSTFQSCHPNGYASYFDIQYPEDFEPDVETRDLLEGLLEVNPEHRFKLDEIEAHPFFNSI